MADTVFDEEVLKAVREATRDEGQPTQLADRLLAWLRSVAIGESDTGKLQDVQDHFEAIASALETENGAS